ncbi:hypothetical protein Skr01_09860 [Sphaerisporangium krabiense]|uniref:Bacterial Pleckstrin homology domain-containing protein n=1 Tax=Sphaerisporangium krabiense TaxID=763782 RepID=A0A7W8ZCF6_9ACTN|nr:hypothetical protein [Sphaerisporangium krabiense]MBB5631484.1 hypothetical protein [Sphaerisporangium krabiense]GII60901.1 hypothetical protein Skr01_09860 [Sphaerisporangium krabiense]
MATVMITDGSIAIEFGPWERIFTGRSRHTIPLRAVRRAAVTDRPLRVARGARRGLTVSGHTKIGVWGLFGGPRQLVAADRHRPGVHLVLDRDGSGGEFDEVVVSVPDAARLVETIRRVAT